MSIIEGALRRAGISLNPTARIFNVTPGDGALQEAIDNCEADNGDVIVVSPGSHANTAAVEFNKAGIIVVAAEMGLPPEVAGEQFTLNAAASYTDGPAAIFTAPCRIVGLGFAGRQTAGESLLIDCQEAGGFSGGFVQLLNCRFSAWYGAMDALIRMKGGALNHIEGCSFDGLFGGIGTGAIVAENDAALAPAFTRVLRNRFSGLGSGKHAIVHAAGSVPVGALFMENTMEGGFSGDTGKFLDNNDVASHGLVAGNWLGGMANKAAAFENLTNSTLAFAGNHYEEA